MSDMDVKDDCFKIDEMFQSTLLVMMTITVCNDLVMLASNEQANG